MFVHDDYPVKCNEWILDLFYGLAWNDWWWIGGRGWTFSWWKIPSWNNCIRESEACWKRYFFGFPKWGRDSLLLLSLHFVRPGYSVSQDKNNKCSVLWACSSIHGSFGSLFLTCRWLLRTADDRTSTPGSIGRMDIGGETGWSVIRSEETASNIILIFRRMLSLLSSSSYFSSHRIRLDDTLRYESRMQKHPGIIIPILNKETKKDSPEQENDDDLFSKAGASFE